MAEGGGGQVARLSLWRRQGEIQDIVLARRDTGHRLGKEGQEGKNRRGSRVLHTWTGKPDVMEPALVVARETGWACAEGARASRARSRSLQGGAC